MVGSLENQWEVDEGPRYGSFAKEAGFLKHEGNRVSNGGHFGVGSTQASRGKEGGWLLVRRG